MRISDWSSDVCSSDLPFFEAGDGAVAELARLGEIAGALRLIELAARGVELFLDLRLGVDLVLLGLPLLRQFGRLLFEIGEFGMARGEPVLRRGVAFLAEGRFLYLHLDDAAVQALDRLGLRFHFPPAWVPRLV